MATVTVRLGNKDVLAMETRFGRDILRNRLVTAQA